MIKNLFTCVPLRWDFLNFKFRSIFLLHCPVFNAYRDTKKSINSLSCTCRNFYILYFLDEFMLERLIILIRLPMLGFILYASCFPQTCVFMKNFPFSAAVVSLTFKCEAFRAWYRFYSLMVGHWSVIPRI